MPGNPIISIPVNKISFTTPQTTRNGNRAIYTRGPDNREVQGSLTSGIDDMLVSPFGAKTYQNEVKARLDCRLNVNNPQLQNWLLSFQTHLIESAKKNKSIWFKPKHKMTDEKIEDNFSTFYDPNNVDANTGAQYPPALKTKIDNSSGYRPCDVYYSDFNTTDGPPTLYPGNVDMIKERSKLLVNGKFGAIWQRPQGRHVLWGITFQLTHVCVMTENKAETQPFDLGGMEVIVSKKRPLESNPPPSSPRKKVSNTAKVALSMASSSNMGKSILLD